MLHELQKIQLMVDDSRFSWNDLITTEGKIQQLADIEVLGGRPI